VVAESQIVALALAAAELSPEVVVLIVETEVVSVVGEPEVVALVFAAAEPEVVSVADVAGLQASADIAVAFDVVIPASVVVVVVDSSGRPNFFAFPNVHPYASSSSSVEVAG